MLIAVFRAQEDAERTARALQERGHEAVLAPVLRVVPVPGSVPPGPFDATIFTSAHGVEALHGSEVSSLVQVPCFCVGARTAERALARGFLDVRAGRADAFKLAALIDAALRPASRLLLVAGRDRKPAIEHRLSASGHQVIVTERYEAQSLNIWPPEAVAAFEAGRVQAALHYSRRSATLALSAAAAMGVAGGFRNCSHHCLSPDVAEALRGAGVRRVLAASDPDEESLLATLS